MEHLGIEISIFCKCVLAGIAAGCFFDLFRIVRKCFRGKRNFTNICDALFWSGFTILFIWWLFKVNDGELRGYVPAGVLSGALIYFFTISKCFIYIGVFIVKTATRIGAFALKLVLAPIKLMLKITHRVMLITIYPVRILNKKMGLIKKVLSGKRKIMRHCSKKI